MKSIIPEIPVSNCKEALEFYKEVFGGEIKNLQLADDKPMFKGLEGKVVHSELHINETCVLYFMDVLREEHKSRNCHLLLQLESEEEINRVYEALKKDGNVQFELQKTFWGATHAVVIDLYGNTWGLNF